MKEIGYEGYVVVECRSLSGAGDEVLPKCVSYLRDMQQRA